MKLTMNILAAMQIATLFGGPAYAEGFQLRDLTRVEAEIAAAFDPEFYHWAIPGTMNLSCCGSEENQIVLIEIDRQSDEIGQQDRSDEAYISELEDVCTKSGIPCRIEEVQTGAGIGRLMSISLGGGMKGVNIVLVQDGDRLTIRSAAPDAERARENAQTALQALKNALRGGR